MGPEGRGGGLADHCTESGACSGEEVTSVCVLLLVAEFCRFTSTETVGLLGTGAQDGHLDFRTAPESRSVFRSAKSE